MVILSLSYPLSAITTTDNGFIFDTFVIIGLKSMLSRLVGALLLTLILHIICFRTSATPIDSLAYFFRSFALFV
jgi:hypothetical protein